LKSTAECQAAALKAFLQTEKFNGIQFIIFHSSLFQKLRGVTGQSKRGLSISTREVCGHFFGKPFPRSQKEAEQK
jgi:hypothetical protein